MSRQPSIFPVLVALLAGCPPPASCEDGGACTGPTTGGSTTSGSTTGPDVSTTAAPTSTTSSSWPTSSGPDPGPSCGDGVVDLGEGCDDGVANADDAACTSTCRPASCGDGLVWKGEEACDEGDDNADDAACTETCALATCGDGLVWARVEACDDGLNDGSYGGCDPGCTALAPRCGDGDIDGAHGEACDDGDANADDAACTAACQPAKCGDGLVQAGVEDCDDGAANADDAGCKPDCSAVCGDLLVGRPAEECDDGADRGGDGCEDTCIRTVRQLVGGGEHTCVLLVGGAVRCWGHNDDAQLGYNHANDIGDEPGEMPPPDVPLGAPAVELAAGAAHTCARLVGGAVRCWGSGANYALGYPGKHDIGDGPGEMPPPDVNIGGSATKIFAGFNGTCVVLTNDAVRCWGSAGHGLGYFFDDFDANGNTALGDVAEEMPPPDMYAEGPIVRITGVHTSTCALFVDGHVRCWGYGSEGELGSGHKDPVWNEPGPAVALGGVATGLFAGVAGSHHCAVLADGTMKCWGVNFDGRLGYGHTEGIGDEPGEMPPAAVPTGGPVRGGAAGFYHTCAIGQTGSVRCWGDNGFGALGVGHQEDLGDEPGELPTPEVDLGGPVAQLAAGLWHTCALLESGSVRCWGRNVFGELGVGHKSPVGHTPDNMPPLDTPVF